MVKADRFFRPWLRPDRTSLKVYQLLAISDGLVDKFKDLDACLGRKNGAYMRYSPFIFDMFGVLDSDPVFSLPGEISDDFISLSLKRARELANCTVAWSGGVDSTFILACFAHENIDVDIAVVSERLIGGKVSKVFFHPKLKKFIESKFHCRYIRQPELIPVRSFGNDFFTYKVADGSDIPVVTGAWADALFFPNQRLKGDMFWSFERLHNGSFKRNVRYKGNRFVPFADYLGQARDINSGSKLFSEEEIGKLIAYSESFGRKFDSRNRIARFLYFISALPTFLFDSTLMYMPGMESFFCTQDFLNLAYSSYWDFPNSSDRYPRDKRMEIDFIRKVFGSDFGVVSNW